MSAVETGGRRTVVTVPLGAGKQASVRIRVGTVRLVAGLGLVLAAGCAFALTLGAAEISVLDALASLVGRGDERGELVVWTIRLPRIVAALVAGAAIAMAGGILQTIVRNPLVAPDIVGISAGASLAAVVTIVVVQSIALLPLAAFAGALAASGLVYFLSWKRGIAGLRLVLVGVGLTAIVSSLTAMVILGNLDEIRLIHQAEVWQTGTVSFARWDEVVPVAAGLGLLGPLALLLMPRLRVLEIGDELAGSLGIRTERVRVCLLVVAAGLAAMSVAIAGPVPFVGLMVPHMARMLAGPMSAGVLLLTAVLGGLLVLASDVVGQHLLSLPVGIVTAAVGAPYFLFLLYRVNRYRFGA